MRFALKYTKILVKKRESQIDLGVLGRSLSCNPLMPRDFSALPNFNFSQIATIKRESDLYALNESQVRFAHNGAIIVDTSLQKDISLVANARHYTAFLIIHKDIFISKYQILESLVYGADCVVLSSDILSDESLETLKNYAQHLGLSVATTNKNDEIAIKSINEPNNAKIVSLRGDSTNRRSKDNKNHNSTNHAIYNSTKPPTALC